MESSTLLEGVHFGRASCDNATWFLGGLHAYVALPENTANSFTLIDAVYREGYGPPPHLHTREDELFCVLEGHVRFIAGETATEHGPGTVAYLPKNRAHTFEPLNGQVRMAIALFPGGLEGFFKAFSQPAKTLGLEPGPVTMPEIPSFLAAGAKYGLEFLPPGMSIAEHPANGAPGLTAVISGAGQGDRLNVIGIPTTVKLTKEQTGGVLSTFITEDPRLAGPPLHIHHNEDESIFVLEGEYRIQAGDTLRDAAAGDVAFFPRGVPHTYSRVGDAPGRLLIVTTPGGYEAFFRDVDQVCASGQPDRAAVEAVAARHGVEFTGPPIAE